MTNINITINGKAHCVYSSNYSQETVLVVLEGLKNHYETSVGCYTNVESFIYKNLPNGVNIKEIGREVLFSFTD